MTLRRAGIIAGWLVCLALSALVIARTRYITDLSAFLPAKPTSMQRLLVQQLRDGPASRLILIALEHGDSRTRADLSALMAARLRADPEFSFVDNGSKTTADHDREFLFRRRYLLSENVSPQLFSVGGLHQAIGSTIEDLASPEGLLLKELVPRDPTGEMLEIIDQLARLGAPTTRDGVWISNGAPRTLLVAQTAAGGSDTDAEERAQDAIRSAFAAAQSSVTTQARTPAPAGEAVLLRMSGPGVFAVAARAKIKGAAVRLSVLSSVLIVIILAVAYRSLPALALGLAPVATGALVGIATVALGYGAVHGVTLGFGITLIGEAVDYSIYYFIQRLRFWPTIRLGVLTSVCGFASLLPAGFPGLAQLGAYSVGGLIAAAAVTRFVLPELLPHHVALRDLTPWGTRLVRLLGWIRRPSPAAIYGAALAVAAIALVVLYLDRAALWNRELAALSPVPAADQRYDAALRADLGAANVLDLVVISGRSLEDVLEGAERAGSALEPLLAAKSLSAFDSPTNFLPSLATQQRRRASLPEAAALRTNLARATVDLALDSRSLTPFVEDVAAARRAGLIMPAELEGTSLAQGFDALVLHDAERWNALMPLHVADPMGRGDLAGVRAALAAGGCSDAQVLDFKHESDSLYAGYLTEAIRFSAAGFAAIVILLAIALRSPARVAHVLAPLVLAVLCVAAALSLAGIGLTLMHLVGMLLIVAVGSNYALFFDAHAALVGERAALTLASLSIANLCTVIGFGLLSFSGVPVLEALGTTVAPGALLALVFAATLTPTRAPLAQFDEERRIWRFRWIRGSRDE